MGTQIPESFLLPFVPEHSQNILQFLLCLRVHQQTFKAVFQIFQRRTRLVILSLVDHARRPTIHYHFHQIFSGHRNSFVPSGFSIQIRPILIVMAIAALVVDPCFTVALVLTFRGIGAAVTLIVPYSLAEFCGRIFRQVMDQSLPDQSHTEASFTNEQSMPCDGLKMFPSAHLLPLPPQHCSRFI